MLAISNEASGAIRGLLESDGVPEDAAFRISAQEGAGADSQSGFAITITDEKPPEDQVVESEDVEVRIEPVAADMLDDKQLDATVADGQIQFSLSEQAG